MPKDKPLFKVRFMVIEGRGSIKVDGTKIEVCTPNVTKYDKNGKFYFKVKGTEEAKFKINKNVITVHPDNTWDVQGKFESVKDLTTQKSNFKVGGKFVVIKRGKTRIETLPKILK
jgi:hypothetical protein